MHRSFWMLSLGVALLSCSDAPPTNGRMPEVGPDAPNAGPGASDAGAGAAPCDHAAFAAAVNKGASSFGFLANATLIAGAVLIEAEQYPRVCLAAYEQKEPSR